MSDDITIDVGMNNAAYLSGADQIYGANSKLQASMLGISSGSMNVQKALHMITPGRATLVGFTALAVAAANTEQNLSGLRATSAVTGISTEKLSKSMRQLARDMPMGNDGSRAIVQQFTQMGVASAGSEVKIGKLATTVARLAGATGEDAGGLAMGMTQFARATGNVNLDPKRYSDLADSLVHVSKNVGASATDVLAFSKNIAPLAQQAGIGATGIMGISASFAHLGEDGISAQTAISKMMGDMSRSVHEGTPEIKNYAEIVGTTAENFKAMYKADPAGTLNKVTKAIAAAGPQGARILETLGLEGVRSQRAIGALVSSGGLQPAIDSAQAGYGGGDAKKAADAAFGGLNDSLTELNSASQQLADSFGAPLLGPLTAFTKALKWPVSQLSNAVDTPVGQGALKIIAGSAALFMGMRAVLGPLSMLGIGRQLGTSGVARAGQAGWVAGRGMVRGEGENGALSQEQKDAGVRLSRMSRAAERTMREEEAGTLRKGAMGGMKGRAYDASYAVGQRYAEEKKSRSDKAWSARAAQRMARLGEIGPAALASEDAAKAAEAERRAGMSRFAKVRETTRLYGNAAVQTYAGDMNRMRTNAYTDYQDRKSGLGAPGYVKQAGEAAKAAYQSHDGSVLGRTMAGQRAFDSSLRASGQSVSMFNENVKTFGGVAKTYTRLAAQLGADTAKIVSRPLQGAGFMGGAGRAASGAMGIGRGLLGAMGGGYGLAVMGGIAGFSAINAAGDKARQAQSDYGNQDMYGTVNAYREASGRAGVPQIAMNSKISAVESATSGAVTDVKDAMKVRQQDIDAAKIAGGKPVHTYSGTTKEIAATIKGTQVPGGMDIQDLQNIKMDLLKQSGATNTSVQAIMDALGPQSGVKSEQAPSGSNAAGIAAMTNVSMKGGGEKNWFQDRGGWAGFAQSTLDWVPGLGHLGAGGSNEIETRSKEQIASTQDVGMSVQARYKEQAGTYKGQYAAQERFKAQNAAYAEAAKNGDKATMAALSRDFQTQDMGAKYTEGKNVYVPTAQDIEKHGGFAQALAANDRSGFGAKGGDYEKTVATGGAFSGAGGIPALVKAGAIADSLRSSGYKGMNNFAANLYDQSNTSIAAKAMQASAGAPGDVKLSNTAGAQFIKAGQAGEGNIVNGKKTAMSLAELETAAIALRDSLSGTAAQAAAANAALQQIGLQRSRGHISMSSTAQQQEADTAARARIEVFKKLPIPTEEQNTANVADQQALIDSDQGKANKLRSYLEAHRSYEKQVARTQYDANKAAEYQLADYNTSVSRTQDAARLQEKHAAFDFGVSQARTEHDFGVTKKNQLRDYNIGIANMELQYNRTRGRALRDFNISQARQIEDAAKTMLNPYDRIQTKATWDVANLMANMSEQNAALEKQKTQLAQLRKMGVSAQVIDQLQLGKSENAQQVNNMAEDLSANPSQVSELNKIGVQRGKDAGALFADASNTENKRAKEDLKKSLSDMAADIKTSLKQSKVAFSNAQNDQAVAFALNQKRVLADYAKNLAWTRAANALNLDYMAADNQKSTTRAKTALDRNLSLMNQDITDADKSILGNLAQLHDAAVKTMAGHFGSYKNIMSTDLKDLLGTMDKNAPKFAASLAKFGLSPAEIAMPDHFTRSKSSAAQLTTMHSGGSDPTGNFGGKRATGGAIEGFSPHSRADNIKILATAGEFMQPVDAVQHYGANTMEKIRTKKIPREALAGYAAGGLVWPSMWDWAHKRMPGTQLTSSYRPGDTSSYHGRGSAIDLAPPSPKIFELIAASFGNTIKELIYSPMKNQQIKDGHTVPDSFYAGVRSAHFNHVHWAMEPGQLISGGGPIAGMTGAGTAGGPSISPAQVAALFGFNAKRGGIYGKIRDKIESAFMAKLTTAGQSSTPGDVGAHGSGAKANQNIAASLLAKYGFGPGQMSSLVKLWNGESGWNELADNPGSDAYGIPQSLPGSKMASMGKDWKTNPATQINWGLNYIKARYGSPDEALKQWNARSPHWYDQGGVMSPGRGSHVNATGKPEAVLTNEQWGGVAKLAERAGELITREESKVMGASNCTHMTVHHNEQITYDSRNDFSDAKITVMSNDPDEMARKLERKVTQKRVSQTRGVRAR